MSTDHDIPVTKETHEHIPTRFQFGLLSMFVVTTAVAVACSMTFSMSDAVAIPLFVLFSVILTGVLITVIVYGRSYQRTFCIGAVVPFGFLLFMLGFIGFIFFIDGTPPRAEPIRFRLAVDAFWGSSILVGAICVGVRRLLESQRKLPRS